MLYNLKRNACPGLAFQDHSVMTTADQLCLGCMAPRDPGGLCPRCGYQQDAPSASPLYMKPGGLLREQYIVGRVLGHGGFGVTYLGFDAVLDRKVAIKEFLPSSIAARLNETGQVSAHHEKLRSDFEFGLQRFLDEARTLARFQGSSNIIGVMNLFPANGTAYMVMEYLEGETFEAYLERNDGRISYTAARAILMPVADALREVHRQNLLHRDVSPDNIFMVNGGPVKLLDFGAARYAMSIRSRAFSVILKEGYAPIEQYSSSGEQGLWTDVYALAGTMYRALTGQVPPSALERHTEALIPPSQLGSDIPPAAEPVLLRALELKAADRYQSVDEFQAALMGASDAGRPASGTPWLAGETRKPDRSLIDPPPPGAGPAPPASFARLETAPLNSGDAASVEPPAPPVPPLPQPTGGSRNRLPLLAAALLLLAILGYGSYRLMNRGPAQVTFTVADAAIALGQRTTLSWDVSHASEVTIDGMGTVPSKGSAGVSPRVTTTYRLVAAGNDGKSVEKSVEVQVNSAASVQSPAPADTTAPAAGGNTAGAHGQPRITFTAMPATIRAGEAATLQWNLQNAASGSIEPSVGDLPQTSGQLTVHPPGTITYILTARAADGATASSAVTVQVLSATGGAIATAPGAPSTVPSSPSATPATPAAGGVTPVSPLQKADPAKGQFVVFHEHHAIVGRAIGGYCAGVLEVTPGHIVYRTTSANDGRRDDFDEPASAIAESKQNRIGFMGRPALHIRFRGGQNYNFAPQNAPITQLLRALAEAAR